MCCVFRPAKTIKNTQKWVKKYLFHHARERLSMTTKVQISNQRLGVTPTRWPTNFFLRFSSRASHVHDEKGTFLLIFKCFSSFLTMRMHAFAGRNTHSFIQYVLSYLQANSKLLFTSHDTIASLYKVNGHRKNHLFLLNTTKWWNNFRENIFD